MSGVLLPGHAPGTSRAGHGLWIKLRVLAWTNRVFLAVVILPTLLAALYFGLVASDQYESSADFVVRRADSMKTGGDSGQLLGFALGSGASETDAYIVQEYLMSHDAVAHLQAKNNLIGIFTRDGVDGFSRLWTTYLTPERLLKFYRKQVVIRADDETSITHLTVHTFRPDDSRAIAESLLEMGEQQVNAINERTYNDQVSNAQRSYDEANHQLGEIEAQFTAYRVGHQDVDPTDTGKAQVTMISGLTANLVGARARMQAMGGAISHSSPQYQAMVRQVQTLEAQVAAQSSRVVGGDHSVANRLGDYEQLVIKRTEIAQVYTVAASQLKQAQADAKRKQLYLIRVVQPNLPVKSEYPLRMQITLTIFGALFFAYAIGWLLWAGVKEHSL